MLLAVVAALGSALFVAVASVLQHRAGSRQSVPTLAGALRHPLWLIGAVTGVAGFGLHVVALSSGALALVQPLLVTGLLFALPIGHALDRRRIGLGEITAAAAVVAGLVVFQTTARPAAGHATAALPVLAVCTATTMALVGATAIVAGYDRPRRAVWLGLCTGLAYGATAALVKASVGLLANGVPALLSSWPVYAFAVVVTVAIAVNQLAFNAGPLASSLPLITIVDPVVSVVIGAAAFAETVSSTPALVAGQIFGFAVMSLGVVLLARSGGVQSEGRTVSRCP